VGDFVKMKGRGIPRKQLTDEYPLQAISFRRSVHKEFTMLSKITSAIIEEIVQLYEIFIN